MLSAAYEYVGYAGAGTFNQSGGTNTMTTSRFQIGPGGTYNLTGGALLVPGIQAIIGGGPFNLGGGTLVANASFSTGQAMTLTGSGGNSNIDTGGHAVTLSGVLSGSGGLANSGSGTLVLCGSNTYTGSTTIAAGTINLDFSQAGAPTANIINNISNSSSLALDSGTLSIQGKVSTTNSQQFNGLIVNPGCSAIVLTTGTANPLLLSMGSISRSADGTVDFMLPSGTLSGSNGITTSTANTNGIIGGYATVNGGTGWAVSNGTASSITAYAAYTTGNLFLLTSGTSNVEPTGSTQATGTSAMFFNSLNLTSSATGVTMSGTGSLTLLSGGLIGNNAAAIITGGILKGSSNGELIVIAPQNLMIGSIIADNGGATALTKAGSGTLTLAASNGYTGTTLVSAGTLLLANTGAISGSTFDSSGTGSLSFGTLTAATFGGLQGSGNVTLNNATPAAVALSVGGNNASTTFSGSLNGLGGLTKAGSGDLILSGSDSYTGGTIVNAGILYVTNSNALPDGTGLTVGAGGTLVFDASVSAVPSETASGEAVSCEVVATVPESGTLALLAVGALGAGIGVWRGREKVQPGKH